MTITYKRLRFNGNNELVEATADQVALETVFIDENINDDDYKTLLQQEILKSKNEGRQVSNIYSSKDVNGNFQLYYNHACCIIEKLRVQNPTDRADLSKVVYTLNQVNNNIQNYNPFGITSASEIHPQSLGLLMRLDVSYDDTTQPVLKAGQMAFKQDDKYYIFDIYNKLNNTSQQQINNNPNWITVNLIDDDNLPLYGNNDVITTNIGAMNTLNSSDQYQFNGLVYRVSDTANNKEYLNIVENRHSFLSLMQSTQDATQNYSLYTARFNSFPVQIKKNQNADSNLSYIYFFAGSVGISSSFNDLIINTRTAVSIDTQGININDVYKKYNDITVLDINTLDPTTLNTTSKFWSLITPIFNKNVTFTGVDDKQKYTYNHITSSINLKTNQELTLDDSSALLDTYLVEILPDYSAGKDSNNIGLQSKLNIIKVDANYILNNCYFVGGSLGIMIVPKASFFNGWNVNFATSGSAFINTDKQLYAYSTKVNTLSILKPSSYNLEFPFSFDLIQNFTDYSGSLSSYKIKASTIVGASLVGSTGILTIPYADTPSI